MCDGKMEKGTVSMMAAIVCGCDRDGKMQRGEEGTASVVAAIVCGSCVAAIAMARWRGGRRAQGARWLQLCCDRDDKMERGTAMWGAGDQN